MRIAVLGVGLIGGSIGLAAKRRLEGEVAGFDADPANAQRGRELGALDRVAGSVREAAAEAEIVFCAAPVRSLPALAAEAPERLPEIGPSFRDTTRVAGANPAIWGDIFATNREAVAREIDAVAARLTEAADLLRAGNAVRVAAWHGAAREDRRRLLEADLVGGELYELRVAVENR